MMSYLLQGHIAVVTGAGSGNGQGIAVGYAVEGAARNFTTGLAAELGPDGVRVNAIGPGLIQTALNRDTIHEGAEIYANFIHHTPLKQPRTPTGIVGPAVFLASDLSQYVTGVTLPVDGGYLTV